MKTFRLCVGSPRSLFRAASCGLALMFGIVGVVAAADAADSGPQDPGYRSESALPAGWPKPGKPGVVELAYLADYKVAEAQRFMTLFGHIKRNGIPMTAPVIMPLDNETGRQQGTMQFIYPDAQTSAGSVSKWVTEQDHGGQWVLRVAYRGRMSSALRQSMFAQLQAEATSRGLSIVGQAAMFGYNSPMMRSSRQTTEIVLPVQLIPTDGEANLATDTDQ